eukprot:g4586.t1
MQEVSYIGLSDVIDLFYDPVSEAERMTQPPSTPPRHDLYYSPRGKPAWDFRSITEREEQERYGSLVRERSGLADDLADAEKKVERPRLEPIELEQPPENELTRNLQSVPAGTGSPKSGAGKTSSSPTYSNSDAKAVRFDSNVPAGRGRSPSPDELKHQSDMEEVRAKTEERKKLLLRCMAEVKEAEAKREKLPPANGLTLAELVTGGLVQEDFALKLCEDIRKHGLHSRKEAAYLQPKTDHAARTKQQQKGPGPFDYYRTEIMISDFLARLAKPQYRKVLADEFSFLLHKKRRATEHEDARLQVDMNRDVEKELGLLAEDGVRGGGRAVGRDPRGNNANQQRPGGVEHAPAVGTPGLSAVRGGSATEQDGASIKESIEGEGEIHEEVYEDLPRTASERPTIEVQEGDASDDIVVTTDEEKGRDGPASGAAVGNAKREEEEEVASEAADENDIEVVAEKREDELILEAAVARVEEQVLSATREQASSPGGEPDVAEDDGGLDDILAGLQESLVEAEKESFTDDLDTVVAVHDTRAELDAGEQVLFGATSTSFRDINAEQRNMELAAIYSSCEAVGRGLDDFLGVESKNERDMLSATFESELQEGELENLAGGEQEEVTKPAGDDKNETATSFRAATGAGAEPESKPQEEDLFGLGDVSASEKYSDEEFHESVPEEDAGVPAEQPLEEGMLVADKLVDPASGEDAVGLADDGIIEEQMNKILEQEEEDYEAAFGGDKANDEEVFDNCEAASLDRSLNSTFNKSIAEELEGEANEVSTDPNRTTFTSSVAVGGGNTITSELHPIREADKDSATSPSGSSPTRATRSSVPKPGFLEKPWLPSGAPNTGAALLMSLEGVASGQAGSATSPQGNDEEVDEEVDEKTSRMIRTQIAKKSKHVKWLEQKMSSTQQLYEEELEELELLKMERSRRATLPVPKRTRSLPGSYLLQPMKSGPRLPRKPLAAQIPAHKVNDSLLQESGGQEDGVTPDSSPASRTAGGHPPQHSTHQPTVRIDSASTQGGGSQKPGSADQSSQQTRVYNRTTRGTPGFRKDPFLDFKESRNKQGRLSERVFRDESIMYSWMHNAREEARSTYRLNKAKSVEELFSDHLFFSPTGQKIVAERKLIMGERPHPSNLDREIKTLKKLRKAVKRSGWRTCHTVARSRTAREDEEQEACDADDHALKVAAEARTHEFFRCFTSRDELLSVKMLEGQIDEELSSALSMDRLKNTRKAKGLMRALTFLQNGQDGSTAMAALQTAKAMRYD